MTSAGPVTLGRQLRRAARIAGLGALTGTMLPPFVVLLETAREDEREAIRRRWVGAWARTLLRVFGIQAEVSGRLEPTRAGRLVIANHRSTADILLMLDVFGGRVVSRADLSAWPLVGPAARAAGTLFVDRADAASGAAALRGIRSCLLGGLTVIVFAEGTTFAGDEVRPFHAGAFVAAARSGAEVVPVGIAYERGSNVAFVDEPFGAHLARVAAAPPSRVAVCVGEPLSASAHSRSAGLRDATHAQVSRLVADARRRVDGRAGAPGTTLPGREP